MGKIVIAELIRMTDEGTPQKDIAAYFGVSGPAVSKALSKLRPTSARPAILDKLTAKEEHFVMEIASGSNQQQAALQAFECSSLDSAKSIGSRLAKDPEIAEAIIAVMESEGLSKRRLVQRLRDHVDGADAQVSIRGVEMGLKLHDSFPIQKKANLNLNIDTCPVDLSAYS